MVRSLGSLRLDNPHIIDLIDPHFSGCMDDLIGVEQDADMRDPPFLIVEKSQIAGPRLLAVYPVTGWWEDSTATWERRLCYSLIVSVDLGEVDLDLYSLAAIALPRFCHALCRGGSSPQAE